MRVDSHHYCCQQAAALRGQSSASLGEPGCSFSFVSPCPARSPWTALSHTFHTPCDERRKWILTRRLVNPGTSKGATFLGITEVGGGVRFLALAAVPREEGNGKVGTAVDSRSAQGCRGAAATMTAPRPLAMGRAKAGRTTKVGMVNVVAKRFAPSWLHHAWSFYGAQTMAARL